MLVAHKIWIDMAVRLTGTLLRDVLPILTWRCE